MQKQVVVKISADGATAQVDAQNFKGVGCAVATKAIELALAGGGQIDDKKKPDYFAPGQTGTLKQS